MSPHRHVFLWVSGPRAGELLNRCACGEHGLPSVLVRRRS